MHTETANRVRQALDLDYDRKYIEGIYGEAMDAESTRESRQETLLSTVSAEEREDFNGYSLKIKNAVLDKLEADAEVM